MLNTLIAKSEIRVSRDYQEGKKNFKKFGGYWGEPAGIPSHTPSGG
jgi:hypothetical protein